MKKRSILFVLLLSVLAVATTACRNAGTESLAESIGEEAVESVGEDPFLNEKEAESEGDMESSGYEMETEGEQIAETEKEAMKSAYISVLENICFEHALPPPFGDELGFDEMFDPAYNKFAVYDIDQDGEKELVILYMTAAVYSDMKALIYGFDAEEGTIREEFSEFSSVTFYDNGIVEAEWPHNHGMAADREDFWPYNVYRYDLVNDVYMTEVVVDAWSAGFAEKDSAGHPFPKEVDIDGDGMVYIMSGTDYKRDEPMDGEAYRRWREECIGEAKPVELPFLSITEENIYTWNGEGE